MSAGGVRPTGRPAALMVVTPVVLLTWKAGVSALFPGMTVRWPDRVGVRCLCVALSSGIAPLAGFLYTWRHTQPAHPRLTGLAIGTAAGAFTWLLVDLWCPVAYFRYLLLGHVLPVGLFAALGANGRAGPRCEEALRRGQSSIFRYSYPPPWMSSSERPSWSLPGRR